MIKFKIRILICYHLGDKMQYFFETTGSMKEKGLNDAGFSHYDATHIFWLAVFIIAAIVCCVLYRKCGEVGRKRWRYVLASLIVADEIFKIVTLLAVGRYTVNYLPLQLCSINIILIAIHAVKPSKTLDNFLYAVCIPAAILALLFPTWTRLPLANFMHIHSFTVHILLALYPMILTVGGDIRPSAKMIPRVLTLLLCLAVPVYVFNLVFDTNYMFLMYAEKGNPLYIFEQAVGNHLIGIPVILVPLFAVAFAPWEIYRRRKAKKARQIA